MLYSCMQLAADDAYTTLYCDYLVYFNFNCKYDARCTFMMSITIYTNEFQIDQPQGEE